MNTINPINQERSKYFLITIDVEDWFQVENFKPWIPFETWGQREQRLEKNIYRLLDLFDSIRLSPLRRESTGSADADAPTTRTDNRGIKATFFVLGWVAETYPQIIRDIIARGHEVASHGCYHELPNKMTAEALYRDLSESRMKLEDATGTPINGFRAPSFAIDDRILNAVADVGYRYDSSYNSFGLQGRYGRIAINGHDRKGIALEMQANFFELPISNFGIGHLAHALNMRPGRNTKTINSILQLSETFRQKGLVLPWGGGGYFRIIPSSLYLTGVDAIIKLDRCYLFYLHPWEVDPNQPRVKNASFIRRFRHYINLQVGEEKLTKMIEYFGHCEFLTCSEYVSIADST